MSTKGKDAEIFNLGAVLLNIPGQEYVFGSTANNPGNPGEHFILCPFSKMEARHFKIQVDKDGEFWIENVDGSAKTIINRKTLNEKKKLNFGDIISIGERGSTAFVYFEFKERRRPENKSKILPGSGRRGVAARAAFPPIASEVGDNHVLVQNVLKHFSVKELKEYRFVSKPWNTAASQLLRKRCAVEILKSYPNEQTKLFRCAKEMETFASNMTSLSVEIPIFPPDLDGAKDAEKFVEDLIKYHLKDSLTYFKISAWNWRLPAGRISLLDTVLQTVSQSCPNLEHVVFDIGTKENVAFELPPNPNWTFGPNLKTLEVHDLCYSSEFARSILEKMNTTLIQKFISWEAPWSTYLPVMSEKNFSNLKEIFLSCFNGEDLRALVNLPSNIRLQKLVLKEIEDSDAPSFSHGFSDVLEKFKQTLVSLTMDCRGVNIVLPSFEKLEYLSLFYDEDTRLTFPPHFLYSTHFPKLKSLMLNSCKISTKKEAAFSDYTKPEALAQWGLNQGIFNSFITNGQVCSSLLELDIPHCPPEQKGKNEEYSLGLKAMRTLFPNVRAKWIKGLK